MAIIQRDPLPCYGRPPTAVELRLQAAVVAGDLLAVAAMFEDAPEPRSDRFGTITNRCLDYASSYGKLTIIRWLLGRSTSIETVRATRAAVEHDDIEMMELFIKRGTGFDFKNSRPNLGLPRSAGMLQLFLKHGWSPKPQRVAGSAIDWQTMMTRDIEISKFVLDHGADLDSRNVRNSWTALDHAARENRFDPFKLFLERGADLSIANPLHVAASTWRRSKKYSTDRTEMMAYLLDEVGLDVNAMSTLKIRPSSKNHVNGTPIQAAITETDYENMAFLLERGANMDLKNEAGLDAWELAGRHPDFF